MERRRFLTTAATGVLAGSSVAAPALAQSTPQVRWRMAMSWPKSLDIVFQSAEALCARVAQLTDGRFQIRPYAAGELVPALQVLDAVQAGTVDCGHTLSAYFFGKRAAYAFDTGVAFGTNYRQQNAWLHYGGGLDLLREVFAKDGLLPFPCGNVGTQMGGWYRKEIKSLDDLKGLKFRVSGLGGMILTKLGVVPQQIPAGDIYSALEKGTIDAAEMVGPHDDERFGFHKVARYYYYPGWWEGSAMVTMLVNPKQWAALPKPYQQAFEAACNEQLLLMMARYDQQNPAGLRKLASQGVQFRSFPRPVMDACYKATFQTFDEIAAKDEDFRKLYTAWKAFLAESNLWFRAAEHSLDSYRYSAPI